ncbi:MAG TPA: hypothetical protein VJ804_15695 [Acidimicrobiales bacterium]|nr:hypothetical protein [Acidimicrobiales bacterium]
MRQLMCALVLAASVAACGGGDDDADADSASTTTTTALEPAPQDTAPPDTGGAAPAQDRAADQALAESIVLRAGDAPAGWTSEPPDDEDDSEYDRRYAECVGVPFEHVDPDFPEARGHDLTAPDDSEVSSGAVVAPSVEAAQPLLAAYRDPDTPACFTDVLEDVMLDALAEGGTTDATVQRPTFEPLPFADLGDETVAFRVTMTISGGSGQTLEVFADAILVRSGRVAVDALFLSLFEPLPAATSESLVRVMVDRIPANA